MAFFGYTFSHWRPDWRPHWRHVLPAAVVALSVPFAAVAQEAAAPAAPAPAAGGEPWTKICNTDPASKKELCLVLQELRADTGQFIASATIRQVTGDKKKSFIAAVPPGMLLQPGMRAQIDTGKQYDFKFGICFPNACYGELEIDDEFITTLKGGSQLTIITMNPKAQGVSFPMTLAGFTKAYDGEGLDAEGVRTKQDDLSKALAARAAAARAKLIEQQQKEGGQTQ